MARVAKKNKLFLIILSLVIIAGILVFYVSSQGKNKIPSKGVFVIERY